jgi:2-polyprenyl-3-methyl-5-hydroxy-6-metoxy-1,4-benzoquinol methylase
MGSAINEMPNQLVWDHDTLVRFWAYHSKFPENYFSFQKGADVVRRVKRYIPQEASVVDYGCGPGFLLPHLVRAGYRVTGADFSLAATSSAADATTSQPGIVGLSTIDDLLSRHEKFDVIFLLEVIEHLDDNWLDRTLTNCRQLLKPRGALIITTPNEERLEDNVVYCPVSNLTFHRWQHVRSWSSRSLRDILKRYGFEVASVQATNFRQAAPAGISIARRVLRRMFSRFRRPQSLLAVARM